jgi:hypothetical protein
MLLTLSRSSATFCSATRCSNNNALQIATFASRARRHERNLVAGRGYSSRYSSCSCTTTNTKRFNRPYSTHTLGRGYLQHEIDGRTFVYSSIEPPTSLAVRAVSQIVDRFCQGSVESLLVGMVDDEVVDPNELQRIVDRLAAQQSAKRRKPAKRKGNPKNEHA